MFNGKKSRSDYIRGFLFSIFVLRTKMGAGAARITKNSGQKKEMDPGTSSSPSLFPLGEKDFI